MTVRLLAIALFALLLSACHDDNAGAGALNNQAIALSDAMGSEPPAGFARALVPREFSFPRDHAAHHDYATEWWYFTGNLSASNRQLYGYQLTLFRVGLAPNAPPDDSVWRANQLYMGHIAISDISSKTHKSGEILSRAAVNLAGSSSKPFHLWLGPWSIKSSGVDFFPLQLNAQHEDIAIDLQLEQGNKAMILQGDRGLSQKGAQPGDASYYYSYSRLPTSGRLVIDHQSIEVSGESWFDREWSSSALADDQQGWDWFALQLDDGRDLMFYRMRGFNQQAQRFSQGVLVEKNGNQIALDLDNTLLQPQSTWTDTNGIAYPLKWRLAIPAHAIDLSIAAYFNEQLMQHSVHYWEGAVKVYGSHRGRGYMELSGYANKN